MLNSLPISWISFGALLRREIARFMIINRQTIFPQIITTTLYILIFGFSLGSQIKHIQGFPYIEFILPGLVLMSVITSSYNNASTFLFSARYDYSIQDVLLTPLSYFQMIVAFTLGSMIRGLIVGLLVLSTGVFLLKLKIFSIGIVFLFLILTSQIFVSFGLLIGLWADQWDDLWTFISYVVTPLIFLGGTFYSIQMLPYPWKWISLFNPIFYMVNGFRYGIIGFHEFPIGLSLFILFVLGSALFTLTVYLFKIGYKLKT
ncbi:MAG: ABC transporter permease [Deltaproteobacteria bacterium]|nr:ABC transporter permease [Deltaproteobacteria bacterium]